jgi:tungstate transport system ATP-binding protein
MDKPILPLRVEQLTLRVGHGLYAIRDVSFDIRAGSCNVILGANGAGKSVLLRLMHGLLKPTSGQVAWSHDDPGAQAMVFQRPVMLRRSVRENIEFALHAGARKQVVGSVRAVAESALARAGLTHLAERPARLCSVGEQQRIALARAWALAPQVLFLDEPTASLDPAATKAVETIVQAMYEAGTTIVMTTHDMGQAKRLANRVLFLHGGRLIEDAPAVSFFGEPATAEARAFIRGELVW